MDNKDFELEEKNDVELENEVKKETVAHKKTSTCKVVAILCVLTVFIAIIAELWVMLANTNRSLKNLQKDVANQKQKNLEFFDQMIDDTNQDTKDCACQCTSCLADDHENCAMGCCSTNGSCSNAGCEGGCTDGDDATVCGCGCSAEGDYEINYEEMYWENMTEREYSVVNNPNDITIAITTDADALSTLESTEFVMDNGVVTTVIEEVRTVPEGEDIRVDNIKITEHNTIRFDGTKEDFIKTISDRDIDLNNVWVVENHKELTNSLYGKYDKIYISQKDVFVEGSWYYLCYTGETLVSFIWLENDGYTSHFYTFLQ